MYEHVTASAMLPKKFALIIGNARSGTTIVGAIIDSHSKMLCANESSASSVFWRDMDRQQILENIIDNCRHNLANQRQSEGYLYGINTFAKNAQDVEVIADKIWNPALLLLAGQRNLLTSLQDRTGAETVLVHCVRNPALVASEARLIHQMCDAGDLEGLIRRYALRQSQALRVISRALGFNNRSEYEDAVRRLLGEDRDLLSSVRGEFEPLNAILNPN